jgi:hypothetical protein
MFPSSDDAVRYRSETGGMLPAFSGEAGGCVGNVVLSPGNESVHAGSADELARMKIPESGCLQAPTGRPTEPSGTVTDDPGRLTDLAGTVMDDREVV